MRKILILGLTAISLSIITGCESNLKNPCVITDTTTKVVRITSKSQTYYDGNERFLLKGDLFFIKWGIGGDRLTRYKVLETNRNGVFVENIDEKYDELQFIDYIDINRSRSFKKIEK